MQPLNFSRQILNQLESGNIQANPSIKDALDSRPFIEEIKNSVREATKFCLPHNGMILDDSELKALEPAPEVRLPFKKIVLEWTRDDPISRKGVALVEETSLPGSDLVWMQLIPIPYLTPKKSWGIMPPIAFPCVGTFGDIAPNGRRITNTAFSPSAKEIPEDDYANEVAVLFDFLNALACSNTSIDRSAAKQKRKAGNKNPLPFDDYHWLVLERKEPGASCGDPIGDRRGPREHVRRGHIRRYRDGKCIWVNSTVVAAGHGGIVTKNYLVA